MVSGNALTPSYVSIEFLHEPNIFILGVRLDIRHPGIFDNSDNDPFKTESSHKHVKQRLNPSEIKRLR